MTTNIETRLSSLAESATSHRTADTMREAITIIKTTREAQALLREVLDSDGTLPGYLSSKISRYLERCAK